MWIWELYWIIYLKHTHEILSFAIEIKSLAAILTILEIKQIFDIRWLKSIRNGIGFQIILKIISIMLIFLR